jgi:heme/copper-type cytochrome/quinol oxidase subunit 1
MTFIPLFWIGFSGLPRRVNDYPLCYAGWQGVSTIGHFFSMLGVLAFYCMLLDSKLEKRNVLDSDFLVPRLSKRCIYYCKKIIKQKLENKYCNKLSVDYNKFIN